MDYLDWYKGKNVLITGHTGFKGSWLAIWLKMLGARVFGVGLEPEGETLFESSRIRTLIEASYYTDIRDYSQLEDVIRDVNPSVVFHLAAEAIVGRSYKFPKETWATNVMGTLNVAEILRKVVDEECAAVFVTSDKCYENKEWTWGYRENDQLGGKDMYSASKAAIEIMMAAYTTSFLKEGSLRIVTSRAGNVIGGGDYSEYRLVPDCIRSWRDKKKAVLRNPVSTRPWQHVLEPLRGYLQLAHAVAMGKIGSGEAFNFGPSSSDVRSVVQLVEELAKYRSDAQWEVNESSRAFGECDLLALNCDKAASRLGWKPLLRFERTAEITSTWYRMVEEGADSRETCEWQIMEYMKGLKEASEIRS